MAKLLRAGVVGFTGYSGAELVRLLERHPCAEPVLLEHRAAEDSEDAAFGPQAERAPFSAQGIAAAGLDVVFLATHHDVSIDSAPMILDAGIKVIDLSGAFRLRTVANYQRWYKFDHPRPDLLTEAAYGLPEFFREMVRISRLVANPGCYPTAANLAIRPLIVEAALDRAAGVVCDAKSGVSGAGRRPSGKTHFGEVTENFSAYGLMFHRHTPEILLTSDVEEHELMFTAQLLPVHRGILETIYVRTAEPMGYQELAALYAKHYEHEPFVRIYPEGRFPDLRAVQQTNFCDIGIQADPETRRVTIVVAEDNLVKGAAGQAVQNMNLLFGVDETAGLL